jgi:colicin import membrane protein
MKKNIRVTGAFRRDLNGDGGVSLLYPLAVSLICHLVFLSLVVFTPSLHFETPPAPSVINVSMVSLKTATTKTSTPAATEPQPAKTKKTPTVKESSVEPKRAAIKIKDSQPPKPKTSLKKKTFRSTEVVKHAIEQLKDKKKVQPAEKADQVATPDMLKSALDRLREQVDKADAAKSAPSDTATDKKEAGSGSTLGRFNEDGKRTAELIDLYRLEVAFQIQKQWAFNEALAGGDQSLVAAIVFKVMPDGDIRDIFFTDRSGNTYLDESAYKAIVKSNPVDKHPKGLNQPYVEMGIRFTPQGVR